MKFLTRISKIALTTTGLFVMGFSAALQAQLHEDSDADEKVTDTKTEQPPRTADTAINDDEMKPPSVSVEPPESGKTERKQFTTTASRIVTPFNNFIDPLPISQRPDLPPLSQDNLEGHNIDKNEAPKRLWHWQGVYFAEYTMVFDESYPCTMYYSTHEPQSGWQLFAVGHISQIAIVDTIQIVISTIDSSRLLDSLITQFTLLPDKQNSYVTVLNQHHCDLQIIGKEAGSGGLVMENVSPKNVILPSFVLEKDGSVYSAGFKSVEDEKNARVIRDASAEILSNDIVEQSIVEYPKTSLGVRYRPPVKAVTEIEKSKWPKLPTAWSEEVNPLTLGVATRAWQFHQCYLFQFSNGETGTLLAWTTDDPTWRLVGNGYINEIYIHERNIYAVGNLAEGKPSDRLFSIFFYGTKWDLKTRFRALHGEINVLGAQTYVNQMQSQVLVFQLKESASPDTLVFAHHNGITYLGMKLPKTEPAPGD